MTNKNKTIYIDQNLEDVELINPEDTVGLNLDAYGSSLEELKENCLVIEMDQDGDDVRHYSYDELHQFIECRHLVKTVDAILNKAAETFK